MYLCLCWRLNMFCDSKRSSVRLDPRIIFRRCLNDYQIFFISSNKLFLILTPAWSYSKASKYNARTIHNESLEVRWFYYSANICLLKISKTYFLLCLFEMIYLASKLINQICWVYWSFLSSTFYSRLSSNRA